MSDNNRVFISCVSREFQHPGAAFAGLRDHLARQLIGADCEVKWQEVFRQPGDDTGAVRKDGDTIRTCAAVIHLIGEQPGEIANARAVADFLQAEPSFLANCPELRASLGDFSDLTYTQWEAFQALHHGVRLFLYVTPAGALAQREHLNRLCLARRYPGEPFATERDLYGQLLGDLRRIIPAFAPPVEQRLAPPRFLHHTAEFFLGREPELGWLDRAWADGTNLLAIIAWGGVGKTALLSEWIQTRFIAHHWKDAAGGPDPLAYFDWSFYDQGTRASAEDTAVRPGSVGNFFEQALAHFGDPDVTRPGKGARLAGLVRGQRSLLILDGLEPLQHPPGSPVAGRLLDPDLRDLITALALDHPGLLIVTSRQALTDLAGLHVGARSESLADLPQAITIQLLRRMQVTGSDDELAEACERFGCHALSLTLLGRFLCDAHGGDIRRLDRVNLLRAEENLSPSGHRTARKVLEAYEVWLGGATDRRPWLTRALDRLTGRRDRTAQAAAVNAGQTLAVLRLTGLFDRIASADCVAALRARPPIFGLTDPLVGLADDAWRCLLRQLERAQLIRVRGGLDESLAIDAHPLIREYFAAQLREHNPKAFRAAHARLFKHLCKSTPYRPDTLDGLQPLYQAVVHGCLTGQQREACDKVYVDRILRGPAGFYSQNKLGAIGANLGAVAAFFEEPWQRVSANLTEPYQASLLNEAAVLLRALGRLTEALEPMGAGLKMAVELEDWKSAAAIASNLSELEVKLGRLTDAINDARTAIDHADRSGDAFWRIVCRTTAADALHQADGRAEAGRLFAAAEGMQREWQPEFPVLYSVQGFRNCDWLLAPAERAAWRALCSLGNQQVQGRSRSARPEGGPSPAPADAQGASAPMSAHPDGAVATGDDPSATAEMLARCGEVHRRATKTLKIANDGLPLLTIALDHLTLARAALLRTLLTGPSTWPTLDLTTVTGAVAGMRNANQMHHLPRALLTAAWCHAVHGDGCSARLALDEALSIAERGPMPLLLADVRLYRVRLWWAGLLGLGGAASDQPSGQDAPHPSGRQDARTPDYPWPDSSPAADLAEARRLIEHHGYGRRLPELADAEAAILGPPA